MERIQGLLTTAAANLPGHRELMDGLYARV